MIGRRSERLGRAGLDSSRSRRAYATRRALALDLPMTLFHDDVVDIAETIHRHYRRASRPSPPDRKRYDLNPRDRKWPRLLVRAKINPRCRGGLDLKASYLALQIAAYLCWRFTPPYAARSGAWNRELSRLPNKLRPRTWKSLHHTRLPSATESAQKRTTLLPAPSLVHLTRRTGPFRLALTGATRSRSAGVGARSRSANQATPHSN
jgi:hypothetical protein